jgi:aminomuconate-semialdehyde/2-hydroxymuconate-6-semialdehyde dehydrogenase
MEQLTNFIGGELVPPASGRWLDNPEPATGRVYSQVPDSDDEDLARAVAAAAAAFPAWRDAPAEQRARCLRRLAALIEDNAQALARAESVDTGKPVAVARTVDIPRASANFDFYAAAATQFASESHATDAHTINYTLRQPIGVVACISPWNLPLYLFTWKVAPALAAGNCVIGKPSEVTPVTAWMLSKLCREAGLPPGVLNVLHGAGRGIGQRIVEHPAIGAISFTGGTATGAHIAASAAPRFRKLSLELGGKNPTLVFADCDFERALEGALRAAFTNQGQVCLCGSRILVEASIYERFRDAFVARAAALRVGDPLDPATAQGAVVSEAHMQKILGCIAGARRDGGNVLCGGGPVHPAGERCRDGWFVAPTVIDGLGPECAANQEEIFGPVATLVPFENEEAALRLANGTRYGLAASLWSRDVDRCHRLAHRLQAGLVWVNCWMVRDLRTPMGGMKDSGLGREGGFEAMRFFTEARNVCVQYG